MRFQPRVALAIAVASSAVASPRSVRAEGKVVRVERPRTTQTTTPLLCEVREDLTGVCVGGVLSTGDTIVLADTKQLVATVRVQSARQTQCEGHYMIKVSEVRGRLTNLRRDRVIGLVDRSVDPTRVRTIVDDSALVLPRDSGSKPFIGVDRDGDGSGDVMLAFGQCPSGRSGPYHGADCVEMWTRRDRAIVRTWQVELGACQ